MIKLVFYILLLFISIYCNGNENNIVIKTTIDTNSISDTNGIKLDTNVRNIFLNSLKEFHADVIKIDSINESFFKEILANRITPLVFVMWNIYDKELFEKTIILIFFKMYNPDITPCEYNLSYRSETNPYILFMLYKYYEMSKKDPATFPLLGRIVSWIVYEYDSGGDEEIEKMKSHVEKMFNLDTQQKKHASKK